jgi:hypothetical protein
MNRKVWTIGASVSLLASLAMGVGTASFAAQSGTATATSSGSSAPTGKPTQPQSSPMTPVEANRQLQQLERIKHRFELSAGNDRGSHSALAARHIQTAINEMKREMQEEAYGKNSTQAGQVQSSRGSTSAANSWKARTRKN